MIVAQKRMGIEPRLAAASSRFRGFGPETGHLLRTQNVESNKAIVEMRKVWGDTRICIERDEYPQLPGKIKELKYSAKDVETFSIVIAEFQGEENFSNKAGLFLSALINNSGEKDFVIHTAHLSEPVHFIGNGSKKNISVKGDAGDCVGHMMESGTVIVEGNAGNMTGVEMTGGTITVKGNAGKDIGNRMKDGVIIVEGCAGQNIGSAMKGGAITVKGDAGDDIGNQMNEGAIIVEGNAGDGAGFLMNGGTIILKRDAGDKVGDNMRGGRITVMGDAGKDVGINMQGGEVRLNGDYVGTPENFIGGGVLHKGKPTFFR
jgi:formylmethanofuran dehydrogenase subunit C